MESRLKQFTLHFSEEVKLDIDALKTRMSHLPLIIRQAIITAVETGSLNLSFRALEAKGCASVLAEYLKVKLPSQHLQKLNLDGN